MQGYEGSKKKVMFLANQYNGIARSSLIKGICLLTVSLVFTLEPCLLRAQRIEFVGCWPVGGHYKKETAIKKKLLNLLLGSKRIELAKPVAVITDNQHALWVLDQQQDAVLTVQDDELKTPRFIGKKKYPFKSLVTFTKMANGDLLFTDSHAGKIYQVNFDKKTCLPLNDTLTLSKPTGIGYNPITKEIWVIETGKHQVVVLDEKGHLLRVFGKRGTDWGEFNFPTYMCFDKTGKAYIVDAMNFRIQVLDAKGNVITVFGSNGDVSGKFASPKGIAVDSKENIYVVDGLFHTVQLFDIKGNYLDSFGKQGQGEGEFWLPAGIYIDELDKIYVADCYNARLQLFQFVPTKND